MKITLKTLTTYEVAYVGFAVPVCLNDINAADQDKEIIKHNLLFGECELDDRCYITGLVDINTGKIENWKDTTQDTDIFTKVCDEGVYTLYDSDMNKICEVDGYVPSIFECNECGWGDYFNMTIEPTGHIKNWEHDLDSKLGNLKSNIYNYYE